MTRILKTFSSARRPGYTTVADRALSFKVRNSKSVMKPINLLLGWPSLRLFPKVELGKAATNTLLGPAYISNEALIYGPDPGSAFVRDEIAKWLTRYYRPLTVAVQKDNIFVANGASGALAIVLDRFTDPLYTRRIWMIEPTYFMACPIFEDAGFEGRLRGVPEDSEGIDLEFLRAKLEETDAQAEASGETAHKRLKSAGRYPKLYRHVIYVVATFSNPSGKVMTLARRKQLVELARKHDALIISDDVYDMVRWPISQSDGGLVQAADIDTLPLPPPRLADVDRSLAPQTEYGNAISNGSFSKIVAPGVRSSWVQGTNAFISSLALHGSTKSGGSPGQMSSVIIYNMLKSGALEKHIREEAVPAYQERYSAMFQAIQTHLEPLGVRITGGIPVRWCGDDSHGQVEEQNLPVAQAGGFFCYIMFPDDLPPADEIAAIALRSYGLKFASGQMMVVRGDRSSLDRCRKTFGKGARLAWSYHEIAEIQEGIQRIAAIINDIRGNTVRTEAGAEIPIGLLYE